MYKEDLVGLQRLGKGTGGVGNQTTSRDYPNYYYYYYFESFFYCFSRE